jgi:hypothetical protein
MSVPIDLRVNRAVIFCPSMSIMKTTDMSLFFHYVPKRKYLHFFFVDYHSPFRSYVTARKMHFPTGLFLPEVSLSNLLYWNSSRQELLLSFGFQVWYFIYFNIEYDVELKGIPGFLTYSSTLKMETKYFSETSVDFQRTALYIPNTELSNLIRCLDL